jgi:hypothetical protein
LHQFKWKEKVSANAIKEENFVGVLLGKRNLGKSCSQKMMRPYPNCNDGMVLKKDAFASRDPLPSDGLK